MQIEKLVIRNLIKRTAYNSIVKNVLLYILFIVFPFVVSSQTKIKSFYFENEKSIPTPYSQNQLALFKQSLVRNEITVLEIYSYTDSVGSVSYNDSLAKRRLDYVSNFLGVVSNSNVKLKPYGLDRKYDVKNYKSWRRVDIYYAIGGKSPVLKQDTIKEVSEEKVIEPQDLEIIEEIIEEKKDTTNPDLIDASFRASLPYIMNIEFIEGTAKIEPASFSEINKMYVYLSTHPSVNILIRGHVCCGNNMRISKNRAKSVYRELLKMGLDKNRLDYVGMSNNEPLVFPEKTNEDRQRNRRVDVKFFLVKP